MSSLDWLSVLPLSKWRGNEILSQDDLFSCPFPFILLSLPLSRWQPHILFHRPASFPSSSFVRLACSFSLKQWCFLPLSLEESPGMAWGALWVASWVTVAEPALPESCLTVLLPETQSPLALVLWRSSRDQAGGGILSGSFLDICCSLSSYVQVMSMCLGIERPAAQSHSPSFMRFEGKKVFQKLPLTYPSWSTMVI